MSIARHDWELYDERMRPVRRARTQNLTPEQAFELYESMWEIANSIMRSRDDADRLLRMRRQEKLDARRKIAALHKSA